MSKSTVPEILNILFVENGGTFGGSEQVAVDLFHGFDKKKFRPVLCCLYSPGRFGEQLLNEGYKVYSHTMRWKYDPRGIFRVASIMRREHIDIVFMSNALLNVFIGRLAATIARVPFSVVSIHSYDTLNTFASDEKKLKMQVTEKLILPRVNRIIALAESHKAHLAAAKRLSEKKFAVVPNGVDLSRFDTPVDEQQVRRRLGVPDNASLVGIVARLSAEKGLDFFLNAARLVLNQKPETHFVIIGDGPERKHLEQLARDCGIAKNVRFTGYLSDVPTVLRVLDVSVLSSLSEAFPLTLLEAMAAECPTVATQVGSVADIVVDGVTGFLVPPEAPEKLAEGILRLLADPDLAAAFGAAGRKRVEEKFTLEHMVRKTESVLLEVVRKANVATRTVDVS